MGINKVVYDNQTLIDLTEDTVTADQLFEGTTAHDASGTQIIGTAKTDIPENLIATNDEIDEMLFDVFSQ